MLTIPGIAVRYFSLTSTLLVIPAGIEYFDLIGTMAGGRIRLTVPMGWLIGALRIMPPFEPHVGGYTLAPTPFWGGLLFPSVVFGVLYAWPWLEQRFITHDFRRHDLLDSPADNPRRAAFGAAFFTWVTTIFIAGAADRLFLATDVPYVREVWIFRVAALVLPLVAYAGTYRVVTRVRG